MNKQEPIVLGWTRDNKGKVTNRHEVEIANCVTKEKASNTQNYVAEPLRIPPKPPSKVTSKCHKEESLMGLTRQAPHEEAAFKTEESYHPH